MDLTYIGGEGGKSVGSGLVPATSGIEIFCLQVLVSLFPVLSSELKAALGAEVLGMLMSSDRIFANLVETYFHVMMEDQNKPLCQYAW